MFRMDRTSFEDLEELVTPHLERDSSMAERSSGSPIPVRTRLAATLRWLAGGSYIDICFAWGLAHSTFYSDRGVLWPTIEAIDAIFDIGNVRAYRTRKGGFGVVVQAGCDVEGRFLFISANHAGSTNDSLAFDSTALKDAID
ncbi:unnamed protein product, partial [Ectocarpus fasciculatus]